MDWIDWQLDDSSNLWLPYIKTYGSTTNPDAFLLQYDGEKVFKNASVKKMKLYESRKYFSNDLRGKFQFYSKNLTKLL